MSASQPLVSAKVRPKDRKGTDGWLIFHAAYSREFAKAALGRIARPEELVLDPFSGSGTTSRAAAELGLNSVGYDINPALVKLAQGALVSVEMAELVVTKLRAVNPRSSRQFVSPLLSEWMATETAQQLRWWNAWVEKLPDEERQFGQAVLVHAARDIVRPAMGSNPTWPRPPKRRVRREVKPILLASARAMVNDLRKEVRGTSTHRIELANACALPLKDGCVDIVLTSPPYLSRIDYVRATLPELIASGWDSAEAIQNLRRTTMGGVLAHRAVIDENVPSKLVHRTLDAIFRHESKASSTYYHHLAQQYFCDLNRAIGEIDRVMTRNGRAIVVVQTSYYKDIPIRLPEIVAELGAARGLAAVSLNAEAVSQHYGHLSPAQRGYVKKKTLTESAVLLSRSGGGAGGTQQLS